MSRLIFNHRLLKLIVFIAHMVIVASLCAFALSIDAATIHRISQIEPVNNLYKTLSIDWLGFGRELGHVVAFLCNLSVGSMIIAFAGQRKHEVLRFFLTAIGVQLLLAAALNVVLFGLIFYGGWWHVFSMIVIGMKAASLVITTSILVMYRKALMELGRRQDEAYTETKDYL